eukprot:1461607-Pleurochrysis_carterae.AAC.1
MKKKQCRETNAEARLPGPQGLRCEQSNTAGPCAQTKAACGPPRGKFALHRRSKAPKSIFWHRRNEQSCEFEGAAHNLEADPPVEVPEGLVQDGLLRRTQDGRHAPARHVHRLGHALARAALALRVTLTATATIAAIIAATAASASAAAAAAAASVVATAVVSAAA